MKKRKYDFAGYVTKNNVECVDGLVIKHGAFSSQNGEQVPLVWQHQRDTPEGVVGHVVLEDRPDGVYGYGYLNETDMGKHSKQLIQHGDINSMSIFAQGIKRNIRDVIHGTIREVSLVIAGANPGAKIDFVDLNHSSDTAESTEAVITSGCLIHSADIVEEITYSEEEVIDEVEEVEEVTVEHKNPTVGEVWDTMTPLMKNAVGTLIEEIIKEESNVEHTTKEELDLKTNLFKKEETNQTAALSELQHSVFQTMYNDGVSLKESLAAHKEDFIEHGITNIEKLFEEAKYVGEKPYIDIDPNTAYEKILNGVKKVPFSRLKNLVADFTEDTARALGYKKGDKKIDQVFKLFGRETYPTTIYKKQSYDRDDVIDITEIDLINFTKAEMRMMLNRELARAIFVGDGRLTGNANKIDEEKIRPIVGDDEFYTIPKEYESIETIIDAVVMAMADYRGSGNPSLYMHPNLVAKVRLLRDNENRFLFGDIPTKAAMAARLEVAEIVPTTFLSEDEFVIVNMNDYSLGANKGGQVTTFDDFDIDFNKLKYLIETRVSGSLMVPKSAIHFTKKAAEPGE